MTENTLDDYFFDKEPEKPSLLNIQLEIKDKSKREAIVGDLMKMLNNNTEIINGVILNQIYFKGADINQSVKDFKEKLKTEIDNIKF